MKKIIASVDPYKKDYNKPDIFIVDYPSIFRLYSKEEAENITKYSQQISQILRQHFKSVNEVRKEKIEKIINSL